MVINNNQIRIIQTKHKKRNLEIKLPIAAEDYR